ncbi:MAG: hypothetical protein QXE05_01115 [Nitrososphaeria archaeon]
MIPHNNLATLSLDIFIITFVSEHYSKDEINLVYPVGLNALHNILSKKSCLNSLAEGYRRSDFLRGKEQRLDIGVPKAYWDDIKSSFQCAIKIV